VTTWPEARAAKAERLRRSRRLFTPDRRGPKCPVCGTDTVKGQPAVHPTCDPTFASLLAQLDATNTERQPA